MFSLLWCCFQAVAAESLVVRVAIDDRQTNRLREPIVLIEGVAAPLLDNGTLQGDVAGDQIFVAQSNIQHQESIVLIVQNGDGSQIGQVEVSVPNQSTATFQLKTSRTGVVLDLNAPSMPIREGNTLEDQAASLSIQALERDVSGIAEGQSEILITIDASTRALTEPMVTINDRPEWVMLNDEGGLFDEEAGDGIYTGVLTLPSNESLGFQVADNGKTLGNLEASLPSAQGVQIQLSYSKFGLSSLDSNTGGETGSMVVQATPKGERIVSTSASDKIALTVYLDDRLLKRLQIPAVTFVEQESAGVNFRDDGINGDEEGSDHVWMASTVLEREEFVQLQVIDDSVEQGQLTVFLPSTSEAVVWLRSTESGIKLVTEPTQGSTGTSSVTTDTSSGTGITSDRLAHVLWVMMTLFAIGFAYVRTLVQQRWASDISPTLDRMNQFLDQQGVNSTQENEHESDNP